MPRCLHIFDSGFQCIDEALDPTDFCEAHQKILAFDPQRLEDSWWRKAFLRLVALLLLIVFLIPLVYSLRDLYFGPPLKRRGETPRRLFLPSLIH